MTDNLPRSLLSFKETFENFDDASKELGLRINEQETKIMAKIKKQIAYFGSKLSGDAYEICENKRT